jgi:hypothetical protein
MHASTGIRNHDPNVRAGEDGSCLRPRDHCERLVIYLHTKFLMSNASGSLVIAVKPKAKQNIVRAPCYYLTLYKRNVAYLGSSITVHNFRDNINFTS